MITMNGPLALLTDFYQLSMAYGYWKAGLDQREAVFQMFFRKSPFGGGFTIAAGLESIIKYLENFRFEESDFDYLASIHATQDEEKPFFSRDFFDYLRGIRFQCDIDAIPEGTAVFPYEPLLRVKGPLLQCQLLETPLLNLINFPTMIATKAARVCLAAEGDSVFEFGLRRAQGIDGALTASRASYIGGCSTTSNVLAGKLYGIPVGGTHSHSWVMVFDEELEAFQAYAEQLPGNCVFLVDTYNSLNGVKRAIEVGQWLKNKGHSLLGIRLDSGDLAYLSIEARKMLDAAGFKDAKIYASNELDEIVISELKRQGAQIAVWGVGTHLVTGKGQSALDGVYKLSAIKDQKGRWQRKLKLSEQMLKITNPGILQVRRFKSNNEFIADAIYDENLSIVGDCHLVDPWDSTKETVIKQSTTWEDLLVPIFRSGQMVYDLPALSDIRKKTQNQLASLPTGVKRFLNPHLYGVWMERQIFNERMRLIREIRQSNI